MVVAQSRHVLVGDQLRNLLLGGEVLARQLLYEDWEKDQEGENGEARDTLLEPWAQAAPPFEIPGGFIEIQARDLHDCLNINQGSNQRTAGEADNKKLRLRQLFERAQLDPAFADRWFDWIDTDEDVLGFGAEDGEYLGRTLAYRTPNALAAHVSEVRLLGEMELEQYAMLREAACVLPLEATQINVNTMTAATLEVLDPDLDQASAAALLESERDFDSVERFLADYGTGGELQKHQDALTTVSQFFEISVRAELDGDSAEMVSTVFRDKGSGNIWLLGRDYSRRFVTKLEVEIEEEDA